VCSIPSNSLNAGVCVKNIDLRRRKVFRVQDYDLAATLSSGQAFRWQLSPEGWWEGVVGARWVRLKPELNTIVGETAAAADDWRWLADYLQIREDLNQVLRAFPNDRPMCAAVAACRGLRLLRQAPWECVASFILSSTKQIVQIRQIVSQLCARLGDQIPAPADRGPVYSFPQADRIAAASETELRACKMGFRAPNLRAAAQMVAQGKVALNRLALLSVGRARLELMNLPGVGPKVADCVLLFAYGFQDAFPVDVWVGKALERLYFPGQRVTQKELRSFIGTYFGPYAGYAQQYLFHYMRVHLR
jgi:N-glycosylase/DNA lyase